jgi:hypothetical protein
MGGTTPRPIHATRSPAWTLPEAGSAAAGPMPAWLVDTLQLLDEHHLCLWDERPGARDELLRAMFGAWPGLRDSQLGVIDCTQVHDLASFSAELRLALSDASGPVAAATSDGGPIRGPLEGALGALQALRCVPIGESGRPIRRRYLVWREAHDLLRRDPRLFGQVVDAVLGSAAESELVSEDLLLIQRSVFIGRASLDIYAEDPRGQFRSWFTEHGEDPLWRCVTGVDRPRLLSVPLSAIGCDVVDLVA